MVAPTVESKQNVIAMNTYSRTHPYMTPVGVRVSNRMLQKPAFAEASKPDQAAAPTNVTLVENRAQ